MSSEIKDKLSTDAAFTITIASLASSTTFVGRQTTLIDNTVTRYSLIHVFGKFKQGTSPTGSRGIYLFAIRGDKDGTTPHRSDNAGASDAAWTRGNAEFIAVGRNLGSPATGDVIYVEGFIVNPGPEFGVGIYHDTGVALDSTGTNSWLRWVGNNPEAQ